MKRKAALLRIISPAFYDNCKAIAFINSLKALEVADIFLFAVFYHSGEADITFASANTGAVVGSVQVDLQIRKLLGIGSRLVIANSLIV